MRYRAAILAASLALFSCSRGGEPVRDAFDRDCRVLADKRAEQPLGAIAAEYGRLTGSKIELEFQPKSDLEARLEKNRAGWDAVFGMPADKEGKTAVESLPGAERVAWKYPSQEPVWAAVLTGHPDAAEFVRFTGGPEGHLLWSQSPAGFTIVSGTSSGAHEWVAEHRVKHTYPMTAMRLLDECGGILDGICIDIGSGPGHLDVELARRSRLRIIGLDIDEGAKPLFEKRMKEAGLQDRVTFVHGDAQELPFPDAYADLIVSRGTLTFIPDIGKCLREVRRVLKPTGVAFLGGRYLYTPHPDKITTEKLRQIVRECGVPGAKVVEDRGQWVKILGPQAPKAAHGFRGGPGMLAGRIVADYGITGGRCLLVCGGGGEMQEDLQRELARITTLEMTALYSSEKAAAEGGKKIREAGLAGRIESRAGALRPLPFEEASFDLVVGIGPALIWEKDRAGAMREIHRVLRRGGAALFGGRFLGMPESHRVPTETLREAAGQTDIPSIRVFDDMGQWVEIRKGIRIR